MPPAATNASPVACAMGIRVHSGWGAAVVVSGREGSERILERRRIELISSTSIGAAQPYHFAAKLALEAAAKHIEASAAASARLAHEGLSKMVKALADRGYRLQAAVILLSSGRALPELAKILVAHPLVHTAEGEFFRQAFRNACQELDIPVTGIRERELEAQSAAAFRRAASQVKQRIDQAGRSLGPPWTTDQKTAALAAAIALAKNSKV